VLYKSISAAVLEVMRQPLEDGNVTIARAAMSLSFPARFMLVAAMNPCPCGYFNDRTRECHCTPMIIQRYISKISGPLLDRIDIHIDVPAVNYRELRSSVVPESSADVRTRVVRSREIQLDRFARGKERIYANAQMGSPRNPEIQRAGDRSRTSAGAGDRQAGAQRPGPRPHPQGGENHSRFRGRRVHRIWSYCGGDSVPNIGPDILGLAAKVSRMIEIPRVTRSENYSLSGREGLADCGEFCHNLLKIRVLKIKGHFTGKCVQWSVGGFPVWLQRRTIFLDSGSLYR
jgi:hypothetical protein